MYIYEYADCFTHIVYRTRSSSYHVTCLHKHFIQAYLIISRAFVYFVNVPSCSPKSFLNRRVNNHRLNSLYRAFFFSAVRNGHSREVLLCSSMLEGSCSRQFSYAMKYPIACSLAMARKRRSSQGSSLNAKLTAVNPDERRRIFLYLLK